MIDGIGVDLVKISRIKAVTERWGNRFLQRVFTPQEISYCYQHNHPYPRLAARFAAKEAFLKALGTGLTQGFSWQEIEVISNGRQQPLIRCNGQVRKKLGHTRQIHLSLSHDHEYAIAQVVLLSKAGTR